MTESAVVISEIKDGVGLLRLNRPEAKNALNSALMDQLSEFLSEYDDSSDVGCIVITGSQSMFSAGADIKEMEELTYKKAYRQDFITRNWEQIARTRKPIIAAVNGGAYGGGCELALMSDMIFAGETAKFGQPEVNLGVSPGSGGTQRLAHFIGKAKTMDMVLTGKAMKASDALICGLVSRVYPDDDLLDETKTVAKNMAKKSHTACMMIKEMVNAAFETPLSHGVMFERRLFHSMFGTEDQKEGMDAFIQKRIPHFNND